MGPSLARRRFLTGCLCCAGAGLAATTGIGIACASEGAKTTLTPDQALDLLRRGNDEFKVDLPYHAVMGRERRMDIAQGQTPFAVLVACSDSRVAPELLFGRGLGELFIVRNAGNTVDTAAMGSIEYAVAVVGVPLIMVLGHERCGAVEAAVKVVKDNATYPGSIGQMIEPIVPAVLSVQGKEGDLVDNAVRANISRTVARLRTASSPLLQKPIAEGRLRVVGARYDLDDGDVDFFDLA